MKIKIYLMAGLLMASCHFAHAQKNLISNGGFEEELESWTDYTAKTTTYIFKSGTSSVAVFAADDSKWLGLHQIVQLPKKSQYILLSAWMKADQIAPAKEAWHGGLFKAEWLDGSEKIIGESMTLTSIRSYQDWQLYEKAVIIPPGCSKIKVMFALAFAAGTMFVDDVSAKILSQDEFEKYQ